MNNETWKTIEGFNNYEVSNTGKVRSLKSGKELKSHTNITTMYKQVILRKDTKSFNRYIHRLVLETFCPNNEASNRTHIIHKDGNRFNNNIDNLEWVERKKISSTSKADLTKELFYSICEIIDKYMVE